MFKLSPCSCSCFPLPIIRSPPPARPFPPLLSLCVPSQALAALLHPHLPGGSREPAPAVSPLDLRDSCLLQAPRTGVPQGFTEPLLSIPSCAAVMLSVSVPAGVPSVGTEVQPAGSWPRNSTLRNLFPLSVRRKSYNTTRVTSWTLNLEMVLPSADETVRCKA